MQNSSQHPHLFYRCTFQRFKLDSRALHGQICLRERGPTQHIERAASTENGPTHHAVHLMPHLCHIKHAANYHSSETSTPYRPAHAQLACVHLEERTEGNREKLGLYLGFLVHIACMGQGQLASSQQRQTSIVCTC